MPRRFGNQNLLTATGIIKAVGTLPQRVHRAIDLAPAVLRQNQFENHYRRMEMKRNLLFLLALGVFLASVAVTSHLMAQGGNVAAPMGTAPAAQPANAPAAPASQRPQIPVAVVDYLYLMEIHPQLYAEMNKLDLQKKAAEDKIKKDMDEVQKLQKELPGYTTGSPQYSAKMEEIRNLQVRIQANAMSEQDRINLAELQLLYDAFKDIKGMVQFFAQSYNISIVINNLDISRRLPAEKSPQTMDAEMSQINGIVWIVPSLDITQHIEKMLNDNFGPKGYPVVDYRIIKEQKYGSKPANTPTGIATAPGQPVPR